MKKFLLAGVAFSALIMGDSAMAADLARPVYRAPVVVPLPVSNWTGIYVGVVGGAGLFSSTFSDTFCSFSCAGPEQAKVDWTAGVTAGANWQFGHGVIGIEGDFNWSNFNNQQVQAGTPTNPNGITSLQCACAREWLLTTS
jgi:outer membrane immunogenic protein